MKTASWILEQLEPRIAPAAVVFANGGNLLSNGDQGYLSQADTQGDATLLVKCTGGKALVFWDSNTREIKGISVSDGANIEILGNVFGDIVTNLESSGALSDSDQNPANGLDGGRLLRSSIAGIKTSGYFDVTGAAQSGDVGRIIAGGSVANVNLSGHLGGVYAGDGIFDAVASAALPDGSPAPVEGTAATAFKFVLGENFDSSGPANISTMTLKMSDAAFAPNASISKIAFFKGTNAQFFAGDGADGTKGPTALGGSISNISFVGAIVDNSATGFFVGKSYTISAGHGGNVSDGDGGAGGSISGVSETNSAGNTFIHAGAGGNGEVTKGKGGQGGSVGNLDLEGGANTTDIASGTGGNGAAGGPAGTVSFANVTSQGPISLAAPFLGNQYTAGLHKDFFLINRTNSDMSLIDGTTLIDLPVISGKAFGPVDAVVADLNNDSYLDVAVIYADHHLGILINHGGDGTFKYTVTDIGFEPFRILAGDFTGDGGNPELAIISTSKLQTSLRLYSATDPTDAGTYISDPSIFKPLGLKKGNLVDAAGGNTPFGAFYSMHLLIGTFRSDITLAFQDGTLQGVLSQGGGTAGSPFSFNIGEAPKIVLADGIRDIDFNFPFYPDTEKDKIAQSIAVVNAAGTSAHLVSLGKITPPEPAPGEPPAPDPTVFVYVLDPKDPLQIKQGSGTIIEAKWTDSSTSAENGLTLLSTNMVTSTISVYGTSLEKGTPNAMHAALTTAYKENFLIDSTANNAIFTLTASSYLFTSGGVTIAEAFQSPLLPKTGSPFIPLPVELPFQPLAVDVATGNGGSGTTGAGGGGGGIKSLNINSNAAWVTLGSGGTSASGAGGSGGSLDNTASFNTSFARILPAFGLTDNLKIAAGSGATVTGSGTSSKGGDGGTITGVSFSTIGHFEKGFLVLGDVVITGGDGGASQSLAAGSGGTIAKTTIYSAKNVTLTAGAGGNATIGLKASAGNGGSISGFSGGDPQIAVITGDVAATSGDGGSSALARAGDGGWISTVNIQNMVNPAAGLKLHAGNGGDSAGGLGGVGGALANFTYRGPALNMSAGHGGNSSAAQAKGATGAGGAITGTKAEITSSGYITIQSGDGGQAIGAGGGAGGAVSNVYLKLDPSNNSFGDETLGVTVMSGIGGNGSRGGNGGLITGVSCEGVYNDTGNSGFTTVINSIAMKFVSGKGGNGLTAEGGSGGSISFSKALLGLSQIDSASINPDFLPTDEALRIVTGDGGNGITKGGAGGSLSGAKAANVKNGLGDSIPLNLLGSAFIHTGIGGSANSGDGGAGGGVSTTILSVERHGTDATGNVRVLTGNGGASLSAKGGAGGQISNSGFTSTTGSNDDGYGVLLQTGGGGTGGKSGGAGGALSNLTVSMTSTGINGTNSSIYGAVLLSGDGGAGTGAASSSGGAGGAISGISQPKDVYSVINLIQAGSGGNSSANTTGGVGGSISNIKSSGAIGAQVARTTPGDAPVFQGQFNTIATSPTIDALTTLPDLQQGIFAGLGGNGSSRGANGSVSAVGAPSIAAIGAADLSGHFERASSASKIATLLLAFDINGSGSYQSGDGFVSATNFNASKDLTSLDSSIITTAALIARTVPFVNP